MNEAQKMILTAYIAGFTTALLIAVLLVCFENISLYSTLTNNGEFVCFPNNNFPSNAVFVSRFVLISECPEFLGQRELGLVNQSDYFIVENMSKYKR